MSPDEKGLSVVLSRWDLGLKRVHPDIVISGSPERTDFRTVVEDLSGRLLIMERIAPKALSRKQRIAETLALLRKHGFTLVQPYLHDHEGMFIREVGGGLWQVVPYVVGVELKRPEYVFDRWRGAVMAKTMLELRAASAGISFFADDPVFSLPDYIDKLVAVIRQRRPDVMNDIERIHAFVRARLYPFYDNLSTGLCHGDYHALNIIWGENDLKALIDWEFVGIKPELYDTANMLSCLGIEDPESLVRGAAVDMVRQLRQAGVYAAASFEHLPALMIAIRFAWISEWLRKKDEEMLRLEFDYFDLLSEHLSNITSAWR